MLEFREKNRDFNLTYIYKRAWKSSKYHKKIKCNYASFERTLIGVGMGLTYFKVAFV